MLCSLSYNLGSFLLLNIVNAVFSAVRKLNEENAYIFNKIILLPMICYLLKNKILKTIRRKTVDEIARYEKNV